MVACGIAALIVAWRAPDIVAQLRRDRLAEALYLRGGELQMQGRYAEAAAAFRDSFTTSARATGAYVALGDVEFKRGRTDEAVAAYRQLMATYPYTYVAELYRQVGLIELRGGRAEDAARDLQQAVTLDPDDWLAFHWLGHAYDRLGDRRSARTAWSRVLTLNPEYLPAQAQLRRLDAEHP